MEVVTLVATASAAFKGLKQLVEAGREIEDCMSQLSTWASAVADIDKAAELKRKPSLFKSLIPKDSKSIQAQAMDEFAAKKAAQRQRDELRQLIQYTQGKHGWEQFLTLESDIRKKRRETVHAELERVQKLKDIGMGLGITVLAIATLGLFIVLILMIQGTK